MKSPMPAQKPTTHQSRNALGFGERRIKESINKNAEKITCGSPRAGWHTPPSVQASETQRQMQLTLVIPEMLAELNTEDEKLRTENCPTRPPSTPSAPAW